MPGFNSLPNVKILDRSKLNSFADNKVKVLKMMIFVFDRVENNEGKEKMLVPRVVKSWDCVVKS